MLPAPISFPKRDSLVRPRRRTLDTLRRPSRLTNLGVLLLVSVATLSVLLNLKHYLVSSYSEIDYAIPNSLVSTIVRNTGNLTHLIMVPGHGIWTGAHTRELADESAWILAPYQRGKGRPAALLEHISKA